MHRAQPPRYSRGRNRKARMHQDSTGRVHSGIASQISFAVGNALRNPDQFRSVPLIGELGRVVKHENKIVRCRYTLTRGLEMARQNVSFADAMIGKKTVGRLRIRPILANERNTLPYVAADPLKQWAKSLAKPRIPKLAPGDFTINPRCCKTGDSIIVPVRAVTQRQAHGAPSLRNQVLSNESQRILPIQVFISRSTPQTHPELWVIERLTKPLPAVICVAARCHPAPAFGRSFQNAGPAGHESESKALSRFLRRLRMAHWASGASVNTRCSVSSRSLQRLLELGPESDLIVRQLAEIVRRQRIVLELCLRPKSAVISIRDEPRVSFYG